MSTPSNNNGKSDDDAPKSRKISFNVTNIFRILSRKYTKATPDDQEIVNTCLGILLILLAIVFFVMIWYPHVAELPVVRAGEVVILSLWVTVIFYVLDRLEVMTPTEERLAGTATRLQELEVQIGATIAAIESRLTSKVQEGSTALQEDSKGLVRALETASSSVSAEMRGNLQQLTSKLAGLAGFNEYIDANQKFGFTAVWGGPKFPRGSSDIFYEIEPDIPPRTTVRYMNTFIRDLDNFTSAVRGLVERGVNVKILVMHPDRNAAVVEARHHDMFGKKKITVEQFLSKVEPTAVALLGLRDEMSEERSQNPAIGLLEVFMYRKSLNFPLIMIQRVIEGQLVDIAFTGFYARKSAEKMPFIEWRGLENRSVEAFRALFDGKFEDCRIAGFDRIRIIGQDATLGFPESSDTEINSLLRDAHSTFEQPSADAKIAALEKLWSAWGRMNALYDAASNRPTVETLMSRVSHGRPKLSTALEDDAKILSDLGRMLHIHRSTKYSQLINEREAEYLFRRMWALMQVLLASETST